MTGFEVFELRDAPEVECDLSVGDVVTWAIGDVHGRDDLLAAMIDFILADAREAGALPTLVMLGDLVDRGPDSRAVIDRLIALRSDPRLHLFCLMGNHEAMMLDFLADPSAGRLWLANGGERTLESFGLPAPRRDTAALAAASEALAAVLTPEQRDFLQSLQPAGVVGDAVFVHAGVFPGRDMDEQRRADLLWIRDRFLEAKDPLPGKVVVHGHTILPWVANLPWRISLDTGAFATHALSAARLHGRERRFFQTRAI